jgi:uncharacterized repeat protein (TIGR03803 family)
MSNGSSNFNRDGMNPEGGLTIHEGAIYGTTFYGGTQGFGTIFQISMVNGKPTGTVLPLWLPTVPGIYTAQLETERVRAATGPFSAYSHRLSQAAIGVLLTSTVSPVAATEAIRWAASSF